MWSFTFYIGQGGDGRWGSPFDDLLTHTIKKNREDRITSPDIKDVLIPCKFWCRLDVQPMQEVDHC